MQTCFRFFRATGSRMSSALPHGRSFGQDALNIEWSLCTTSLGHALGINGRDVLTWGLGTAGRGFGTSLRVLQPGALPKTVASANVFAAQGLGNPLLTPGSVWSAMVGPIRWCQKGQLSRQRVPKGAAINDNVMSNVTQLKFGLYGIRALSGKRVAANTLEAVRRTLRRKLKKTARLWVRMEATVPVTRKPLNIRMGKGKGAIAFYATAVRPGQIMYEMDRVTRTVALQAMQAAQHKFPVKLGFVEWS
ncbi:hypothetical protein PLESTB_000952400 [Pleodorina starrii]|uniref:Ribosomal protein L16 n=1 Tax=Pleodorina starrii TaxID=330485 RepID=A0A9W6BNR7_9CHLO|nr:hypothetical protein PLESTM_001146300 [Pleodorina starrii]GLC55180.1 hypothetical protein PLESTB_000952400 [Pleodorina starrii]GLC71067.1 hypothetical protein PLESTF_001071100 [Pleodorina starrii]